MDKEINNLNSKMKEFKLKYVSVNNLISSSKNESEKYSEIAEKLKLQLESDKCSINELEKKLLTLEHRSKDPEKVYISSLSQSFPKISADALKVFSDLNFEFKKESKILLEKRTINHKDITKKENNVNSLNQTKSQLLIEYDQITADYKSYQNIFDAQTNSLRSGRFELENINTAVNQLNLKISEAKNKIRASNNELKSINEQLSNAHGFNIENSSKKSRSIVIQSLKQAFSTIHGRVYEFCEPRNSKYNLAVTRILGQHLNSIIVDTFDSTRDAISFLKTERINQECFLPIDTIKPYVINPSVKRFSELNKVPFLIDVLKYDQKFHNIYSHLCKDTLICKNSEEARNFAYERVSESGEKLFFKTVSYDGIVFKKSGFITGGMSDLKTKAKVWDEAQINNLMEKQASLNLDIRKNLVILRQEKELSDYLAKSKYLESRNENLENSLKSISSSIENTKENLSIVGDKIKTIDCQINDSKTDIRSLFEYDDRIKNDLFTAFSEIFQNFCSHQDINCESLYEIVYEKSKRTFDIVEKQIEQEKSELSSQIRLLKSKNTQQKIDSIGVTKKNIELSIDKNIEIIQNLEKVLNMISLS
ncbi:MAG: Structural maintenance of chromosomes protein 1A, variant 3, partial [Marteilia pararefringens]